MINNISFQIIHDDAFNTSADVLILKYAQSLYGLDRAVYNSLSRRNHIELPLNGREALLDSAPPLRTEKVLFVGVESLSDFGYSAIRNFARRALESLARSFADAEHVVLTVHGPGYGLDETEAFESEVAGLLEAITTGNCPPSLRLVTFVETDAGRAERLRKSLRNLLPSGQASLARGTSLASLSRELQRTLRTAGYESAAKPHIFVAMPFASEMEDIYHYGIQGAVKSAGFVCERADLSSFTGDVMDWVKSRISSAKFVVADLSTANPNVYLEDGFAWAMKIPTILLATRKEDLKFDVRGQRCIIYGGSIRTLERELSSELDGLKSPQRP